METTNYMITGYIKGRINGKENGDGHSIWYYWDTPFGGLRVEEVSFRRLRGHI